MKLFILSLLSVGLTLSLAHASDTTEDRGDTIEAQCKSEKTVSLVKFNSGLLGKNSEIFYDCVSKNLYINDSKETNAPVKFTFMVSNNLELYFFLPSTHGEPERSRQVKITLSQDASITVMDQNKIERKSFERRGNFSRSFQNIPFLDSIVNVPGWETVDPDYEGSHH